MKNPKAMDSYFAKLHLVYFVFVFGVNCISVYKGGKTLQEKKRLLLPNVTCSSQGIEAMFGPQVRRNVKAKYLTGAVVPVPDNEESCGVKLVTYENKSLAFLSKYDSCFTTFKDRKVAVPLHVQLTGEDHWYRVNVSCPLVKRQTDQLPRSTLSLPRECKFPKNLRVVCGDQKSQEISSEDCSKLGCCYDDREKTCFYKLNSCSLDGHFVFSVTAADLNNHPISPSNFIVKDHPNCFPVITTSDTAVFKVGLTQCGVKMLKMDKAVVYEVEVEDGSDSSFSLQVSCEYEPEMKKRADLSALFTVTNPPPAVALGNVEVQMRIARDASFTSFFAEEELPVTLPLRKVAHVEISIVQPSPDPALSLRVRDCFAYPATKHSVWNLLQDGCPNPLDDMHSSIPVDSEGKIALHSQVRRFDVRTFAFLDSHTGHHSTEPVYFYCWVEICTRTMECAQHCSITSSEGERKRREALYTSDNLHLISLGPLLAGQNDTDVEDNPCLKSKKMFQVTLYILFGIIAALLLLVSCLAFNNIRRCRKGQGHAMVGQENTE